MKTKNFSGLAIVSVVFLAACFGGAAENPIPIVELIELPPFLEELSQIDDYPFYTAQYRGDYAFDDYLESGIYPEFLPDNPGMPAYDCSCFFADGETPLFGRNFDWYENPAMLLFTDPPDGYRSVSMVDISYMGYDREFTPIDDPEGLRYAPYYPFDGMNEHGLVVGMMSVGHAEGGSDSEKVTLGSLELIRLMLDHAQNVAEALDLIKDYNVDFGSVPIHYLVSDADGNSAIIEYLNDEIIVTKSEGSFQVSTNFIIAEIQPAGASTHSRRYNTLVKVLEDSGGRMDIKGAMDLLGDVSQSGGESETRWSVVYDMRAKTITVAIDRDFRNTYQFRFD